MGKLGARTRAHAVAIALVTGLIISRPLKYPPATPRCLAGSRGHSEVVNKNLHVVTDHERPRRRLARFEAD